MAKGKDVRIRVILECISCVRKGANEESTGISRYSTKKESSQYTRTIRIQNILSLLSQAYDSSRNKEIGASCVRSFQRTERVRTSYLIYK